MPHHVHAEPAQLIVERWHPQEVDELARGTAAAPRRGFDVGRLLVERRVHPPHGLQTDVVKPGR
eukprot:3788635-Lingulodinium_polyedra.AAC.1